MKLEKQAFIEFLSCYHGQPVLQYSHHKNRSYYSMPSAVKKVIANIGKTKCTTSAVKHSAHKNKTAFN